MTIKHLIEFSDESARASGKRHDSIAFDHSGVEILGRFNLDEIPFISGNRDGLVKLGELLIRIGLSEYQPGFHIHIHENFDPDKAEILAIGIQSSK